MRKVFDNLSELKRFLKENPQAAAKRTVYKITNGDKVKYTLTHNPDQALAIDARNAGVKVEAVGLNELMN